MSACIRLCGNAVHKSRGLVTCALNQILHGEDDTVGACIIHENGFAPSADDVE